MLAPDIEIAGGFHDATPPGETNTASRRICPESQPSKPCLVDRNLSSSGVRHALQGQNFVCRTLDDGLRIDDYPQIDGV